jgi:hypothetical protein
MSNNGEWQNDVAIIKKSDRGNNYIYFKEGVSFTKGDRLVIQKVQDKVTTFKNKSDDEKSDLLEQFKEWGYVAFLSKPPRNDD